MPMDFSSFDNNQGGVVTPSQPATPQTGGSMDFSSFDKSATPPPLGGDQQKGGGLDQYWKALTDNKTGAAAAGAVVGKALGFMKQFGPTGMFGLMGEASKGSLKDVGQYATTIGQAGSTVMDKLFGNKSGSTQAGGDYLRGRLAYSNPAQALGGSATDVAGLMTPMGEEAAGVKAGEAASKIPLVGKIAGKVAGVAVKAGSEALKFGGQELAKTGDAGKAKTAAEIGGVAGAAAPVVEKALPKLFELGGKAAARVGQITTGVAKEKFTKFMDLVKNAPEKLDAVKENLKTNSTNPFQGMAENLGEKINGMKKAAADAWATAKDNFESKNPNKTFDISQSWSTLNEELRKFGVVAEPVFEEGKLTPNVNNLVVKPEGKLSRFTTEETQGIQKAINLVKNAKDYSLDDLNALKDQFDHIYDSVALNQNMSAKPFHAAIMSIKSETNKLIGEVLPPEMKAANNMYKEYYDVYDKLGNKIADAKGNIKTTAEKYLSNLSSANKGVEQDKIMSAGKKIGIDVLDHVKNTKLMQELSKDIPQTTKNRTMDFIRGALNNKLLTGGAAVGTASHYLNPAVGVPAIILNLLSSPSRYSDLLEVLTNAGEKIPSLDSLSAETKDLVRRVLTQTQEPSDNKN